MRAYVLFCQVLWILQYAIATEFCMDCRSVDLQIAPGIGIDLTMGYGTAAIKYRDGTIHDIVKIDGSPDYISAMKALAEDAQEVRNGRQSKLPEEAFVPPDRPISIVPIFPNFSPSRVFQFLVQEIKHRMPIVRPKPILSIDPWTVAVAAMISDLKHAINAVRPLSYGLVIISIPDFEADTRFIYLDRFKRACQQGGLEQFGSRLLSSRSALRTYGIDVWHDNDDNDASQAILSISYSKYSLGTTILTRWLGTLWPAHVSENATLGSGASLRAHDPEKYWAQVKHLIERAIATSERVDRLLLVGTDTRDADLLRVMQEVFEKYEYQTLLEEFLTLSDAAGSETDLFAAARGAATVARRGMKNGFDACLVPNRCEQCLDDEDGWTPGAKHDEL